LRCLGRPDSLALAHRRETRWRRHRRRDLRLNRFVALKFLSPELTRDADAKERFVHEAQAASALDHPNICTIHEIDETPDRELFLMMAYYEGETLRQRIERGPLSMDEAIDIATEVAHALARAHESGIVHRDIKPANLMLPKDGPVKIVDFGLAKLVGHSDFTKTGTTSALSRTWRPSRFVARRWDRRQTSGRSTWCCTRC
jgi:serine/threonine protein kinase